MSTCQCCIWCPTQYKHVLHSIIFYLIKLLLVSTSFDLVSDTTQTHILHSISTIFFFKLLLVSLLYLVSNITQTHVTFNYFHFLNYNECPVLYLVSNMTHVIFNFNYFYFSLKLVHMSTC